MKLPGIIFIFQAIFCLNFVFAKQTAGDSMKLDYKKIYANALNGNIRGALELFEADNIKPLSSKDRKFKNDFENRFRFNEDKSTYLDERKSQIDDILIIYRDYWRASLLDNSKNYDSTLQKSVSEFLSKFFPSAVSLSNQPNEEIIEKYFDEYIKTKNLYSTGFGKTGNYFDLLVWKKEKDTTYNFTLQNEVLDVKVIFMDDFITLGWEEYATLNRYYPGGWASKDALYCVRKAYDLKSENFLISYLAHEGRHLLDYKLFPNMQGADLEYRAKLTELSLAKESIFKIIETFINNADSESTNPHPAANYRVIKDLSRKIFGNEFEKDMNKWKEIYAEEINKVSMKLFEVNTNEMMNKQEH